MIEEHGFPLIKMEEEEEQGWAPRPQKRAIGFAPLEKKSSEDESDDNLHFGISPAQTALLKNLAEERKIILNDTSLNPKHKKILLDENRKAIVVASGGKVTRTDSVVYGILLFGGIILVILALLTVFAGLPHEIALSFVGTVLGGTIATIAQKLGKI